MTLVRKFLPGWSLLHVRAIRALEGTVPGAGTQLVGLVPVTTDSSHITVGVVEEAEGLIMEDMVTWATGIRTVMGATQEVRIGGTKVHHATMKLLLF